MKVAYCKECQAVIASGDLPEKVRKVVEGKWTEVSPVYSHSVVGNVHEAKLVEVSPTSRALNESADSYLKRLTKTHKAILKAVT